MNKSKSVMQRSSSEYHGEKPLGLNCGGCGHVSCKDMEIAGAAAKANKTDYKGPNCVFKVTDLGIAVGSAVKTASIHNVE